MSIVHDCVFYSFQLKLNVYRLDGQWNPKKGLILMSQVRQREEIAMLWTNDERRETKRVVQFTHRRRINKITLYKLSGAQKKTQKSLLSKRNDTVHAANIDRRWKERKIYLVHKILRLSKIAKKNPKNIFKKAIKRKNKVCVYDVCVYVCIWMRSIDWKFCIFFSQLCKLYKEILTRAMI